jgi:hypothetical protein
MYDFINFYILRLLSAFMDVTVQFSDTNAFVTLIVSTLGVCTHTAGVIAVSGSAAGGFVPPLPDDILLPPVPAEEGEDVY